ncbi:hypothetical protein N9L47_03095 [Rhodobacteraceae bacterium]|nr:hypothetical protein [Paracoccaceae bacterium]
MDRWWPVTYDFGLIKSDIHSVAALRSEMYEEAGFKATSGWLDDPLEQCFSVLEPLTPAPTKELFIATTFGWTAFLSNGCRGSHPFLPMFQLSKALYVPALRVCQSPAAARYQAVIMEVYDTPQSGADERGYRRSIAAANDGGQWVFEQSGSPYPFEDLSKYEARLKRDRFTPEMLSFYLENLGIPKFTDGTLQPDGISKSFVLAKAEHGHLPSYSLCEAKALWVS